MERITNIILYKHKILKVLAKYNLTLDTLETDKSAFDLCAFYFMQIVENISKLEKSVRVTLYGEDYKELNSCKKVIKHNYKSLNKKQFIELLDYVLRK